MLLFVVILSESIKILLLINVYNALNFRFFCILILVLRKKPLSFNNWFTSIKNYFFKLIIYALVTEKKEKKKKNTLQCAQAYKMHKLWERKKEKTLYRWRRLVLSKTNTSCYASERKKFYYFEFFCTHKFVFPINYSQKKIF